MNNQPDFNLRNLEDYTEKDLHELMFAVAYTRADLHNELNHPYETKQALDIWGYRIRDAMAVARKREAEEKDDDSLFASFKGIFK